jgi:ribonucleoside-diphosphate reductase alpha chain
MMGFQDALFKKGISYDSQENLDFSDISMEMISYYSIKASANLAKEKGSYETYKGSKWDRGIFPLDTLAIVEEHRGRKILVDRLTRCEWDELKTLVSNTGMRNSNVLAIAPTATIANISGVYPCTEPVFKNIYMKENLSGNFIVINRYLIDELDKLGLWNDKMLNAIKLKNGSIQDIKSIPASLHSKYKETFEIEPEWIIKSQAKRMKWIDQSASCNVFINTKSGKLISDTYKLAWNWGLKTTYYLRTLGATQVNKTIGSETSEDHKPVSEDPHVTVTEVTQPVADSEVCSILDPDCEACQ